VQLIDKRRPVARRSLRDPTTARIPFSATPSLNAVACHVSQCFLSSRLGLSLLVAQDIGVTSVDDGHGRAAEELSACSAQFDLRVREEK
jgi:hypothetical protein